MIAAEHVEDVRAFNRFYTRRMGVLADGLLGSEFSLGEARVLFELAQRGTCEVLALRRALDLDPSYLSRILARLETAGAVERERSRTDGRRQIARLTPKGRRAFAKLDSRSAEEIGALLSRLDDPGRRRLLGAMRAIRELLDAGSAAAPSVELRRAGAGDYGWIVARNGEVYAQEYGWDADYEALVARIVADAAERREAVWIAEVDGARAGCVMCVHKADGVAQLRLLLVDPAAGGLGVGGRLVDACVAHARGEGYREIVLWTQSILAGARRIYERAGFVLVDAAPHRSFGQDLVGQHWALDLAAT